MATTRRLSAEVVGNASGFLAMMNRVTNSVTRFGGGLGQINRNAQTSNRYLQAMSTTLRYAFAGRVIFGIQNAITNLGEFKTQLGQLDALASRTVGGKLQGLGGELDQVGKEALLMSNRFGIAVGDVESYMQRFFSAFNPPGSPTQRIKEMNQYTNAILNLATSIGTEAGDPQKLAGGLTGLINALPGGRKHPGKGAETISNYFAAILRQTPQLTGADIATAAGRFSSAATLARMTVPQILSTFGVAAQTGGSPAVIIRGITQLLGQSLLHPTKPASLATYQAAGLPTDPNMLAKLGGQRVLERLIGYVQSGGAPGSKGRKMNLDAIYNAFSRQESVRQFVAILANGGVPALRAFEKSLKDANKTQLVTQMANKRLQQSILVRMRNASQNLGISVVNAADWPLENLIARPLIATSNAAIRHPVATQAVLGGALSLGAANALRKMGALGRFSGLSRFIKGASAAEQAVIGGAIAKEELPAAISGGKTDGSRGNPFWVIISPLSWQLGGPAGGFGSGGGGGIGFPTVLGKFGKSRLLKGAGIVGAALTIDQLARSMGWYKGAEDSLTWGQVGKAMSISPQTGLPNHWGGLRKLGYANTSILSMTGQLPSAYRAPLLAAIEAAHIRKENLTRVTFEGNPKADLTVRLVDSHGKTLSIQEHKGVPILPKAKVFPSSQGKPGSRKASKQQT